MTFRNPCPALANYFRCAVTAFTTILLLAGCDDSPPATGVQPPQPFDTVIAGGRVIDGTGNPWFIADVGIRDGRIAAVGDLAGRDSSRTIDASGLIVAPGFIDLHSHSDDREGAEEGLRAGVERRRATNIVTQGVTTIAVNPDGFAEAGLSIAEQRRQMLDGGIGPNVVLMAAHNAIRGAVMGADHERAATGDEIEAMQGLVREAMEQGAFGLTTGLEYAPGIWSDTQELIALMQAVEPFDGVHISHIRSETSAPMWWVPSQDAASPPQLMDGVRETIEIAEQSKTRGVISHMKVRGTTHWGMSDQVIKLVEAARRRGVEMYGDQYPYDSSGSDGRLVLIPDWAIGYREDTDEDVDYASRLRQSLDQRGARQTLETDIRHVIAFRGGATNIKVFDYPDPEFIGKDLHSLAASAGIEPTEMAIRLQLEGFPDRPGGVRLRSFSLEENDMERLMSQPWVATSSDGGIALPVDGPAVHARYNGAFTRKIARYVRERELLTLAFAVRAATSLPAQILGMNDRGILRTGLAADVVVLDESLIQDNATFTEPHQLSSGVLHVLVGGEPVVTEGKATGALPGEVLQRGDSHANPD